MLADPWAAEAGGASQAGFLGGTAVYKSLDYLFYADGNATCLPDSFSFTESEAITVTETEFSYDPLSANDLGHQDFCLPPSEPLTCENKWQQHHNWRPQRN